MKRDLLKIVTVIAIIFTMTMANFIFLCATTVSYAADAITKEIQTNHNNVDFEATLKQGDNESNVLDAKMNSEDLQMHFKISVKQQGYLNGEITLDNSNFRFKPEILSEGVTEIQDNKITLSQINAGETRDIIVGIEVSKPDQISLEMLGKESTVTLTGIYRDSTEKDISIEGVRTVTLNLTSPYDESYKGIVLNHQMVTNKVANYDGEQKRIMQFTITSGMENNLFPIKSEKIVTTSPKINDKFAEKVLVNTNGLLTSTGKEISDENWKYDEKTGNLEISINNDAQDNKVAWNKTGSDIFIITYIFSDISEVSVQDIKTNSEINLYDKNQTRVTSEYQSQIHQEDLDSMITVDIANSENEIYKGKLQEGIDREFSENVTVGMNIAGVVDSVSLIEGYNNLDFAEVYSRRTTIVKDDMLKVLGDEGRITIYNSATSEIIAELNKDTQTDENGNIVIIYPENVQTLRFEFNGIKSQGKIRMTNTKVITNTNSNRVRTSEGFEYYISGEYFNNNLAQPIGTLETKVSEIKLLNTQTSARLEVNKTELSAMSNNDNVEIRAILQTRDESNELYRNPHLEIVLPEQVTSVNIKSINLLYENELTIANYNVEGNKIIVNLSGEQTQYKEQAIEGAVVIINADITVDMKAGSSEQSIKLTYSNEKAVNYQNGAAYGETEQKINIVSYAGLVSIVSVPEYGVEVINNEGNKSGKLELSADGKTATMNAEIMNNTEGSISNVEVLGLLPTNGAVEENNIDVTVTPISVQGLAEGRARVYYSTNAEATKDLQNQANLWTEQYSADAKKYLIVIDKLDLQETATFGYQMSIPEKLEYNDVAKQKFDASYMEDSTGVEKETNIDYITLETGAGPIVETNLEAVVGSKVSNTVNESEILTYRLTIANTGSETVNNITLQGQVPNGMVYVEEVSDEEASQMTDRGYIEYPDKKTVDFQVEKLEPGEIITREYQVRVQKDVNTGRTVQNQITFKYGEVTKQSNLLETQVQKGDIQITLYSADRAGNVQAGYTYRYVVSLKNISDQTVSDIILNANIENGILQNIMYFDNDSQVVESETNTIEINSLAPDETEEVAIYTQMPVFTDEEAKPLKVSATVEANGKTYYTNEKDVDINSVKMNITNISENSGDYVKAGDNITYKITMTNEGTNNINNITLKDSLVKEVSLVSVQKDGQNLSENDYTILEDLDGNGKNIEFTDTLAPGETREYTVNVVVNGGIGNKEAIQIVNVAEVTVGSVKISQASVTHILEPVVDTETPEEPTDPDDPTNPNDPTTPEEPTDPTNPNNPNTPSETEERRIISGTAWFDQNENGQKDEGEQLLSGITVYVLDIKTNDFVKDENGRNISVTTNNNGFYTLEVPQGQYMVIFEYDTSKYVLTTYQEQGVDTQFTSKVVDKKLTIDGEERNVGGTEVIEVSDSNISNINIGLKQAKVFDLRLDKYVSRVIVQNSKGTTNIDFGESTMAKAEIDAKLVNSTSVVVEYKIKITNEGETDGYVRSVVDYLSSDYKFSSELNKDWYQSNGKLYNTSLANEKIQAGETKELTLTVTKQLTENNMGLISNTAELEEVYNEQGLADKDSVAGNNTAGEDDYGKADLILSIKTGQVVATVSIIVVSILVIVAGAIIVTKIVMKRKII